MTEPIKRRRWFRFSLRMLLVVMTVLCVWLGFKVNAARRQKEAVDAITKAGGQVSYDYQMVPVKAGTTDDFSIDADASSIYPAWLRHLFGEDYFRSAVNVTFLGGTIPEADLARLADLPDVRSIYFCQLNVSPTGLAAPRHLQDSDLAVFRHLRELRDLNLLSTDINGAGLEFLASLKHLRRLHLTNLPIGDAGMKLIGKLTALETAYVEPRKGFAITDAGLKYLTSLTRLRDLDLSETAVTPEGIRELQNSLPNTKITGP